MGDFKDTIDWDKFADASELDEFLGPEELSESDLARLQVQSVQSELEELGTRMQKRLDRMKYYGESVDYDELEFLHREVLRIRKNFG